MTDPLATPLTTPDTPPISRWPAHLSQGLPTMAALAMLVWVGRHHVEQSPLAVALLVLIGITFLAGALSLHRYRADTAALDRHLQATTTPPDDAARWLAGLPASLRPAVRARLAGHWLALPGPSWAPFLTGLLVLLGMLGTFLGMVATLRGTGLALNSAADVQAIRGLLTAPIQGLGQAFGTSVAGVAASALLGLMGAAARRERLGSTQRLDAAIADGPLAPWTAAARARAAADAAAAAATQAAAQAQAQAEAARQRDEAARQALEQAWLQRQQQIDAQAQAQASAQAQQWQAWLAQHAERSEQLARQQSQWMAEQHSQLQQGLQQALRAQTEALQGVATRVGELLQHSQTSAEGLQQGQAAFHAQTQSVYTQLAHSVAQSLHHGLAEQVPAVVQAAVAATVQAAVTPVIEDTRATVLPALEQWRLQMSETQAQLADTVQRSAHTHLTQTQTALAQLLAQIGTHLDSAQASSVTRLDTHAQQLLSALAQQHQHWQADWAEAQTLWRASQQAALDSGAAQARAHTEATVGQLQTLVHAAAEAPRAAAELMGQLRQALSDSLVRDTAAMAEREQTLAALQQLLSRLQTTQAEQSAAQQQLLDDVRLRLQQQAEAFAGQVARSTEALDAARTDTAQLAGGIQLGATQLQEAVAQWGRNSETLAQQLHAIEQALAHTLARSDEQLAYYVAQAREVVDLTLGAHQQMVHALHAAPAPATPLTPPTPPTPPTPAARLPEAA